MASPDQPCAAGVYTSPVLLPLVAHLLESFGALGNLEAFVSTNGRRFYQIPKPEPASDGTQAGSLQVVKLCRTPSLIANSLDLNEQKVVPFWAGKQLDWSLVSP